MGGRPHPCPWATDCVIFRGGGWEGRPIDERRLFLSGVAPARISHTQTVARTDVNLPMTKKKQQEVFKQDTERDWPTACVVRARRRSTKSPELVPFDACNRRDWYSLGYSDFVLT